MSHPYEKYEGTKLWQVVCDILKDLKDNQDLELTTKEEYVIGYICNEIDNKLLKVFDAELDIN